MHANGEAGSHMTADVLVDALLAGGASGVGLLAGMTFLGVRADPVGVAFVVIVSFSTAFISSLQAARGRRVPAQRGVKEPRRGE